MRTEVVSLAAVVPVAHAGPPLPGIRTEVVPLAALVPAALLYSLGLRRRVGGRRARVDAFLFAAGLGALVVALASPVAALAEELFWAHMVQHVLILAVAPPLILLGRPWSTISRVLPIALRRKTARAVVHRSWMTPAFALALFCGVMVAWHVPVLYDATLRSSAVHVLEHALFLATGLLFWSQLIDSPPFRSPLDPAKRALWAALAMSVGSAVGLALAFASAPLYAGYADLSSRPGGISALADQHLAAGIMWVPGSIPFAAAFIVFVYRWLGETARDGP
jgi:putative membrane protein